MLADEHFESEQRESTGILTNLLAYLWSDHRPIWVRIWALKNTVGTTTNTMSASAAHPTSIQPASNQLPTSNSAK